MRPPHRNLIQGAVSSVALVAAAIMLSEFFEDIVKKTNNMPCPKGLKPFLFASLAVLIALEGTKVRNDFEEVLDNADSSHAEA